MTVYALAQLTIRDRERYNRYQSRFMEIFQRFSGRLLAADEHPHALEGRWPHHKVVLMSFPDQAAFQAWAQSPEYLEIAKDRKAGAEAVVLLVQGVPTASV